MYGFVVMYESVLVRISHREMAGVGGKCDTCGGVWHVVGRRRLSDGFVCM